MCHRYARTAKKIDIKGLKEDIWGSLEGASMGMVQGDYECPPPSSSGGGSVRFSDTMKQVDASKFEDVSVSYCFICLLHLANEKSLSIFGTKQTRDGALPSPSPQRPTPSFPTPFPSSPRPMPRPKDPRHHPLDVCRHPKDLCTPPSKLCL